jgi:hypothetical protein
MYKNFDEYITDDKAVKQLSEQRSIGFDVLEKSFSVVKKFIITKNRIIYGGMSIDMALKASGNEGIYAKDSIPDYDFMSPDAFRDSIELADLLYKEFGDVGIDSINALHPTTRRVRINFVPVADITFISPSTYDRLPTIGYNGFRVIHPTFQRLDMHRAFCNPLEHVPREVVFFRTNKDIKRFGFLDDAYPLAIPKIDDKKTISLEIPTEFFEFGLIGGCFAHALLMRDFSIDGNKIIVPANLERVARTIVIVCEEPMKLVDRLGSNAVKYYSKFQDDVRPPSIVVTTKDWTFDIQASKGRQVPYVEIDSFKVVSHHGILMHYLERHFNTDESDLYMYLYSKLLEGCKKERIEMTATTYGFYNWSLPYLVNAQRQYSQIEGYEIKNARPPHKYDPAEPRKMDFDPKSSWVFEMSGSEIPIFNELSLRQYHTIS